jgi:hypothetical protein
MAFSDVPQLEKYGPIRFREINRVWLWFTLMSFHSSERFIAACASSKFAALKLCNWWGIQSAVVATILFLERNSARRNDIYNILWAVVFGFATLNILSLAARRFEPNRRGLSFGELMAVLIVLLSIFLLGWELLSVFRIFPLKLGSVSI